MAITILPNRDPGTQIGTGLGNALSSGLQNLAQVKLQQMLQQQQQARGIPGLQTLGYSPEQASSISGLDPQIQREIVKQKLMGPSNEMFAQALNQTLGGGHMQQSPQGIQQALQQGSGQALGMQQQGQQPLRQGSEQAFSIPAGLKPQQALQLAQLGLQRQQVQTKEQRAEQMAADKETLPFYKETLKEAQSARNNDKRLTRMDELIKTGKLSNPTFNSALKTLAKGIFGFGIDLHTLQNPESQEFEKLSNDFIKEAKSIFGSRLTDADLNAFLRTVPNLSLSNEGKVRVMQNMRQFNEASKIKEKALRDIVKENGGKRPRNLEILVEERTRPQIDALAQQFKGNFENVPSTQSFPESLAQGIMPESIYRDYEQERNTPWLPPFITNLFSKK